MARFIVTLYLAESRQCAVSREVTRADDERAIFFAQNWLHQSRMSTRILWQWYDSYLVEEVNKDGERKEIARGAGEEKDCYRAGYKAAGRGRGTDKGRSKGIATTLPGMGKGKPHDARADYLPIRVLGGKRATRKPQELSPYQQKLRAVVAAAQERHIANGDVSRMGSNTHD